MNRYVVLYCCWHALLVSPEINLASASNAMQSDLAALRTDFAKHAKDPSPLQLSRLHLWSALVTRIWRRENFSRRRNTTNQHDCNQ